MSQGLDLQLLFALAIVIVALAAFGYAIWHRVAAIGFTRDDFDRRAPWLALGVIIGGAVLYYVRH
jgi:prolipoprotein diacylglyceryltransferase